ncbi:MAG: hypothetical protein LIP02_08740 [Bacteroidales bacterium]|nr:hypothetical protein [Bacteroidales bacterium]
MACKLIQWLKESNRYKHLIGGTLVGLLSDGPYCAAYAAVLTASALEYKDKAHGGAWDWLDWLCTVAGAAIGYGIRALIP